MSTQSQTEANQANAQRSTGPKTPEGKAASAQNATKHGLSGAFRVLPNEDQAEFDRLLAAYREEFEPKSEHELFLVEEMAQARWTLSRFRRLESVAVEQLAGAGDHGQSIDQALVSALANGSGKAYTAIKRYGTAAQRAYYKALAELKRCKEEAAKLDELILDMRVRKSILETSLGREPELQNEPNRTLAFEHADRVRNTSKRDRPL